MRHPPSTIIRENRTKNDASSASREIVTRETLETLIRHLELGALVFGALVVIGVAGETVFGVRIWWNNRKLQKLQQSENAALQVKISDLQQKAAEADAKAEGFRLQIAQANDRALRAEATAKGFESQIADANARTAQAELELARIKQPRSLNPAQQQRVANTLLTFAGQKFAFLVFGDPESLSLLTDIDGALKLAKWNRVNPPSGLGGDIAYNTAGGSVPSINEIGLKVWIAADDNTERPIVLALASALSSQGVPCEAHLSEWLRGKMPGLIVISVGQKRP
jgi:hypothetical protein